jgi:hypothetical protein
VTQLWTASMAELFSAQRNDSADQSWLRTNGNNVLREKLPAGVKWPHNTYRGPKIMLPASDSEFLKNTVERLTGVRKPLSEKFSRNPSDTHLALELKVIDDQIAECNRQIQSDRSKRK